MHRSHRSHEDVKEVTIGDGWSNCRRTVYIQRVIGMDDGWSAVDASRGARDPIQVVVDLGNGGRASILVVICCAGGSNRGSEYTGCYAANIVQIHGCPQISSQCGQYSAGLCFISINPWARYCMDNRSPWTQYIDEACAAMSA